MNTTFRTFLILLTLSVAWFASAAPRAVVKLEPYRKNIAVHAVVGGREGFFVFDTGSGISLLAPRFAEKIGCKQWGRITGFTMMGHRIDAPRCDDVAVALGGQQFESEATGVFDVMTLYPEGAQPVDGILALNIFDGKAITINFPAMTLTVESSDSLRKTVRGAFELPTHVVREVQGRATAVSIGVPTSSGRVWMELDSGNGGTILVSKPYASLFGLDATKEGPQDVDFALAGDLRVCGRAFAPDMTIDGNIGMPFLKDVVLTIDLAANRVWIRRAQ